MSWLSWSRSNLITRCSRLELFLCRMRCTDCQQPRMENVSPYHTYSWPLAHITSSQRQSTGACRGGGRRGRTSEATGRDGHVTVTMLRSPLFSFHLPHDACVASGTCMLLRGYGCVGIPQLRLLRFLIHLLSRRLGSADVHLSILEYLFTRQQDTEALSPSSHGHCILHRDLSCHVRHTAKSSSRELMYLYLGKVGCRSLK